MQAVFHAKGLLSLPSNPKTRAFLSPPNLGLRQRFNLSNSLKPKPLNGLSVNLNGFQKFQGVVTKPNLISQKNRTFHVCRAEAAAASADGRPVFGQSQPPKVLGIEVNTLKKIPPLGLLFYCIIFNYTILRDTKDVLVVTAKGSSPEIMAMFGLPFAKYLCFQ